MRFGLDGVPLLQQALVKRAVGGLIVVLAHRKIDGVCAPCGKQHSADGGDAQGNAPTRDWETWHADVLSEELSRAELAYSLPERGPN